MEVVGDGWAWIACGASGTGGWGFGGAVPFIELGGSEDGPKRAFDVLFNLRMPTEPRSWVEV